MNADSKTQSLDRGREAVKTALINAACEMLAESGPNGMSVRNVANRAGVNHGQVHHYFGGKEGLIEAAASHLAREHYNNARARSEGSAVPEPLTLREDSQYLQAIVRLVLDGKLNVAAQEIDSGQSIPVEARRALMSDYPNGEVPVEAKARFAFLVAMELGWAALEPFIMRLADVNEKEQSAVRDHARVLARQFALNVPDQTNTES